MRTRYGYPDEAWREARLQAETHLLGCARARRTTTYGELAGSVDAIRLRPYSFAMLAMLSEACRGLDETHGTVLASLVCRKDTGMPGEGYFRWAERSGRDVADREGMWRAELRNVYARLG